MTTIHRDRFAEQLREIAQKRIAANTLVLPSLPSVVATCLRLLEQPDFSLKDGAAIIERDPLLAAKILRVANSAALATREPAKTIPQALTRLGVEQLRTFLVEISARKVFESKDRRIGAACRGIWEHSRAVAVLARDLSALAGGEDQDVAYLAGLLHDVGKPVMATLLLELERAAASGATVSSWIESAAWFSAVQGTHRNVGIELAKKWELPDPMVVAIRDSSGDFDTSDRLSAANAVRLSNAVAKREGFYVGPVDVEDNEALIMVGRSLFGFGDEILKRACDGLEHRIRDAFD